MKILKEDCVVGRKLNELERFMFDKGISIQAGPSGLEFYIGDNVFSIVDTDNGDATSEEFPRIMDTERFVVYE